MNKNDIKLIVIILIIVFLFFIFKSNESANYAYIYYESNLILKVDLNINDTYTVKGFNGDVIIEVNNNKIRVNEENSSYNLCSKQGYISKPGESIICLPNKIIIELINEEIDTEVK